MPRKVAVHWHGGVKRWYAAIGAPGKNGRPKEVYAPTTIGPKDEEGAWAWLSAERAKRAVAEAPVAPDLITVATLGELYLAYAEVARAEKRLSEAHYLAKGHHVGHLAARLGARSARSLTRDEIDRFVADLQKEGYSPNYVANICATVSAAFHWGRVSGRLTENPIAGFRVPTVPDAPERVAEREEAAAWLYFLLHRTPRSPGERRYDRMNALMQRVLIQSGARPGELCCMQWADIKWEGWTTPAGHVGAKVVIPPERWKVGRKTGKPRTIYVSPMLTRALRRLGRRPDRHPEYVFVHGRGRGGRGENEPWADGSTLSKTTCRLRRELIAQQEAIRGAIAEGRAVSDRERWLAGIVVRDGGENRLVSYRWRHTTASTSLMRGIDVPTVAKLLGTSSEMIYRNYGHLLDSHLADAAAKMLGGRRTKPTP